MIPEKESVMANIPNDPMMLLSFVNTKLRDEYSSFQTLCYELELDASEITRCGNTRPDIQQGVDCMH